MIKKIKDTIRAEYKKNKVVTIFMGVVVLLALLTYLKPGSTENILQYIGITAVNFLVLAVIIFLIWIIFINKKGKLI